jgi:antitoxin YefM
MFPISTSYTDARQNLATLLNRIEEENAIALITRRGHKDIAILPADELTSILESLHLLRSPKNAERLFAALDESRVRDKLPDELIESENLSELTSELGEVSLSEGVLKDTPADISCRTPKARASLIDECQP